MTEKRGPTGPESDLRRRAEKKIRADGPKTWEKLSPEAVRKVFHELQVHQIELEMQNEELRRAQQDLEASRSMYFELYDLAPVGYLTVSEGGLILEANLMAADLFGVARGECSKQPLTRFILPEDQDIYYRHRKQLFETGAPQVCELRLLRKDGGPFWVRLGGAVGQDADGAPLCRVVMSDITEHRRAEEALRSSEQQLHHILDNVRDTVWLMDLDFRTKWISRSVARVRGYSLGELAALPPEEQFAPQSYLKILELSANHLTPEKLADPRLEITFASEFEFYCKDGGTICMDSVVTLLRDNAGKPEMLLGVARDITERKRKESEYSTLIRTSLDGFWISDSSGLILDANDAMCRMLGYRKDEFVGKRIADVEVSENQADVAAHISRIVATGSDRFQTRHRRKDGRIIDVEISVQFVAVLGNRLYVFAHDITAQKTAEARERLAHSVLERLNRPENAADTIRDILRVIKESTGFEAVGIRLREGDDFPYFRTNGFPEHFVEMERFLCQRDEAGKVLRDENGNPVLECMCGNVLAGRTNPKLAFFTEGGSFWTNSTTDLLASTTEKERQTETRNRCNAAGYESVALIPLRVSEEIIGLLQLNDHRLNQLTPEMIRFFEGLGASVGIALSRKRAEDALRESEDRFLDVLHASSDAMLMIDTERFVDCNEATVQLLGYSTREEFLTTHPSELSPPTQADGRESFEKANEMMKLAFESGFHQFEWIHRKANGEDFPVQVSLTPILVQGKNLLHCVWRDITAHKLAESALQASESRFRGIFDHVTDGILLADIETKAFVIANWAICEILGYSEEELLKLQVNDIHPADSHAAIEEAFGKLLRGEIKIAHDLPVVRKDGSVFFADISAAPITIENRRLLMANFRDVTEKRALQAAAAQNDRLASMGMLAAGVAHEVNNPLSYVLYNLESLSDEIPRLAAYRDALERHLGAEKLRDVLGDRSDAFTGPMFTNLSERFGDALGGVGRIKAIVRDLGTFSRVDSDDRQPVNFSHAIEQAVSIAYNEIRYRARLVKDFGKLPTVLAGDGRIAQVFLNLLINAARAIDEGDIENNQIRVHTWVEGDFICAEVSDTGRGIPAEHLERIFEPFFTTRPGGAGSGLGLAICRNIISSYKGTIEVESVVGKGTRFLIRLPVLGEEAEARPIEAAGKMEPEVPAVRGRILVVDDEPGIRSVVTKILGREHEVLSAASGKEGQATIENDQAFDVILCDLMMPGMSGMALHDWLSGFNPTLARQVVFITGGAFTPKASDYLDKVGNLRIEKPFEAADLRKTVNELIVAARNGK